MWVSCERERESVCVCCSLECLDHIIIFYRTAIDFSKINVFTLNSLLPCYYTHFLYIYFSFSLFILLLYLLSTLLLELLLYFCFERCLFIKIHFESLNPFFSVSLTPVENIFPYNFFSSLDPLHQLVNGKGKISW